MKVRKFAWYLQRRHCKQLVISPLIATALIATALYQVPKYGQDKWHLMIIYDEIESDCFMSILTTTVASAQLWAKKIALNHNT